MMWARTKSSLSDSCYCYWWWWWCNYKALVCPQCFLLSLIVVLNKMVLEISSLCIHWRTDCVTPSYPWPLVSLVLWIHIWNYYLQAAQTIKSYWDHLTCGRRWQYCKHTFFCFIWMTFWYFPPGMPGHSGPHLFPYYNYYYILIVQIDSIYHDVSIHIYIIINCKQPPCF